VMFLTTRTLTGSKVDVFHQSQPFTQSSDVTHAVRVVKNVTCLSSLLNPSSRPGNNSSLSWILGQGGNIFFENTVMTNLGHGGHFL
jgi:hypothetical protein